MKTKYSLDVEKARIFREQVLERVNSKIYEFARLSFIHPIMMEKKSVRKINKRINREHDTRDGLGFDVILQDKKNIRLGIIRKFSDPSLYIKAPSDVSDITAWIEPYFFLLVSDDLQYYNVLEVRELYMSGAVLKRQKSKHNKNRYEFIIRNRIIQPGNFSKYIIDRDEPVQIFGGNDIVTDFKKLLK